MAATDIYYTDKFVALKDVLTLQIHKFAGLMGSLDS